MDRGLHWANLGILFMTALIPFPTAVVSDSVRKGNLVDERVAVGLYALMGALLCVSWLVFCRYLRGHPELYPEQIGPEFFHKESTRALAGIVAYAFAGFLGYLITPLLALDIFAVIPISYALTSHGLYELATVVRRRQSRSTA
jgi:uncharacterized membrane protein